MFLTKGDSRLISGSCSYLPDIEPPILGPYNRSLVIGPHSSSGSGCFCVDLCLIFPNPFFRPIQDGLNGKPAIGCRRGRWEHPCTTSVTTTNDVSRPRTLAVLYTVLPGWRFDNHPDYYCSNVVFLFVRASRPWPDPSGGCLSCPVQTGSRLGSGYRT